MSRVFEILQPHSDDAWLSNSSIITSKNVTDVVTVCNEPERIAEDKRLYGDLGIQTRPLLKNAWYDKLLIDNKRKGNADEIERHVAELTTNNNGYRTLREIIIEYVAGIPSEKTRLAPLGVKHPFHFFVYDCVMEATPQCEVWYYRDFPHAYRAKSSADWLEKRTQTHKLLLQTEADTELVYRVMAKYYKTQGGFIRNEYHKILDNHTEEIYIQR
jgi:hypothetical protein